MSRPRFALVAGVVAFCLACMLLPAPNLTGLLAHVRAMDAPQQQVPPPSSAGLQAGTPLDGEPAPAFTLHDQNGNLISLNQFDGEPVVLTFFDSVCPHPDCSIMAQYIQWGAKYLGSRSSQVAWVALSLNPWHDTPATARAFIVAHNVKVPLHYMLGSVGQMSALWSAYHIESILQPDGIVIHSTGVYLLDKQGREREFLDEGFDPQAMASDVNVLLAEPGSGPAAPSAGGQGATGQGSSQSLEMNGDVLTFSATPGQYGTYGLSVTLRNSRGAPISGATVTADLDMTDMLMDPEHVTLAPAASIGNVYAASGVLTMAGPWRARIHVAFPAGPQVLPNVAPVTPPPLNATFQFTAQY